MPMSIIAKAKPEQGGALAIGNEVNDCQHEPAKANGAEYHFVFFMSLLRL